MSFVGSDFEELQAGNNALTELRERFPDHPLAAVARIVHGTNAAREFKQVGADNRVAVRQAKPDEAAELLSPVLDTWVLRATWWRPRWRPTPCARRWRHRSDRRQPSRQAPSSGHTSRPVGAR